MSLVIEIIIGLCICATIFVVIMSISAKELNENADANIARNKRLQNHINDKTPAYGRYLGKTNRIIKHKEYYVILISKNDDGYIVVTFRNRREYCLNNIYYLDEDNFFKEWRLLKDED